MLYIWTGHSDNTRTKTNFFLVWLPLEVASMGQHFLGNIWQSLGYEGGRLLGYQGGTFAYMVHF